MPPTARPELPVRRETGSADAAHRTELAGHWDRERWGERFREAWHSCMQLESGARGDAPPTRFEPGPNEAHGDATGRCAKGMA